MNPFVDLGAPILAAFGGSVTLRRYDPGSYDAATGRWTAGDVTESTIAAAVQPLVPREIKLVPENERTSEGVGIYTRAALLTSDVGTGQQADEVVWAGKVYKVVVVENWVAQARYSRAIAMKVED